MKSQYMKPFFYAESYAVSDSIAKCNIDIDTTPALTVTDTTKLCTVQDEGHTIGGKNGQKGSIVDFLAQYNLQLPITIFNDGDGGACMIDWDGRRNYVYQTGDNFARTFFGNNATPAGHAPGYDGASFLS